MKLLLLAIPLVALALAAPFAQADDTTICQPTPSTSTCVRVNTDDGWVYVVTCTFSSTVYTCWGGGHWDYTPVYQWVGNGAGGYACVTNACVFAVGGQESYYSYFRGYGGVGVQYGSTASASVGGLGGTYNGAPYQDGAVCASSFATGGTCVLV